MILSREECCNVKPGERYVYRGKYGGHKEATYDATVVSNNTYNVCLSLMVRQDTVRELIFGPQTTPIKVGIAKADFGIDDKLYTY